VNRGAVAMSFPLSHASDFRSAIPGMTGKTPELEANSDPAYVVIFSGAVALPAFGGPPHDASGAALPQPDRSYTGVVCVVVNGTATVYYDVDTSNAHAPQQ
jgi:hypothetical protein